jgi:transcriptional regulator with XRE-family HTH domain
MQESTAQPKPLKDLIEQSGHTQKSFAQSLGKAYSTVQYYVAGEKSPTVQVFADMCRVLNQSPKTVMQALGIDTAGIPDDSPN